MTEDSMNLLDDELNDIDLNDKRLDEKSSSILNKLLSSPYKSINGSFDGWAESKSAYNFFGNPKVKPEKILDPHCKRTLERIKDSDIVLFIQDTTDVNYSTRAPIPGLGKLSYEFEQGFYMHPTIAVTPERIPLGIVNNKVWTREDFKGKEEKKKNRPIEEKESMRWIESYRICNEIAKQNPGKLMVDIADREADIYELFLEYDGEENSCHWLVRANMTRIISASNFSENKAGESETKNILSFVKSKDSIGKIEFDVPKTKKGRSKRTVMQEIRISRVKLSPPKSLAKKDGIKDIEVTAILCTEINTPEGQEPVEWLLLTSLVISDEITAEMIIDFYRCRWMIEVFFRTLKTGCKIEKLQLETYDRLINCITLYCIVSWRILFLTLSGRRCPELSCDIFYNGIEWKAACMIYYKKAPPEKPPTLQEMNLMVASFGGYLNRKGDGEPGAEAMWIGLSRLRDFALALGISESITYG